MILMILILIWDTSVVTRGCLHFLIASVNFFKSVKNHKLVINGFWLIVVAWQV